jgi:imidazolonepropionase-like amidohydrolase
MRAASSVLVLAMIGLCQCADAQNHVVIAVGNALDGKGKVLHDTRIVVSGSKIIAIDRNASPIDYDLRGLTVMPGWIDAHVHITSSFGPDGKNAGMGATTPEAAYRTAANAYATLLAGFTTIQSMDGVPALREAAAHGGLPAPRILAIAEPIVGHGEQTGTPDEVRAFVRKQKDAGADFLKIYASAGMRQTAQTIPQPVLDAACDEARKAACVRLSTPIMTRCTELSSPAARRSSTVWARRTPTCIRWPRKAFTSTLKPGSSSRITWTTVRVMPVLPFFLRRRKSSSR